jgi:ATP-dependent helicase/nuclease subunit A
MSDPGGAGHGTGGSVSAGRRFPRDQGARDRIERDFERNLLVEAGAGSGKTHSLAGRMAAGIATGAYEIEYLAAVTFTRKAAAELRGRFQLALEEELDRRVRLQADPDRETRIRHALSNLERFFAGTIHSFCAHLLRERPVESGVAPGFTELDEAQDAHHREQAWRDYISAARAGGQPELLDLLQAGVRARDLDEAFRIVSLYQEVDFPPGDAPRPDLATALKRTRAFWSRLQPLMPARIPDESKCAVLAKAEQFRRLMRVMDDSRPAALVQALEVWHGQSLKVTKKWWGVSANADAAGALLEEFREAVVRPFLRAWREYVYRLGMTVLVDAREYAGRERRRHNTLNYGDLLELTAGVLRENAEVRRALQQKYRWLFVDEFQDTDPVQAEIILLLASSDPGAPVGAGLQPGPSIAAVDVSRSVRLQADRDGLDPATAVRGFSPAVAETGRGRAAARPAGNPPATVDWTRVSLRPGALFVVGDPKQSIYRFRRADIDIYSRVKERILASGGEVVPLTANFRSVEALCGWANDVFMTYFPEAATQHAPAFEPLDAFREDAFRQDVFRQDVGAMPFGVCTLTVPAMVDEKQIGEHEAESIARYIRDGVAAGRRKFGDFLLLTRKKKPLATYARVLERHHVPVEVSGAGAFGESEEVRALAVLLRALADPQDAVSLVGALRGPFFGLSDPELFDHVHAGGRLWLFDGIDADRDSPDPVPVVRGFSPADSGEGGHRDGRDHAGGPVARALASLREMHRWTRLLPPAAAVERILERTGYLALAATIEGGAGAGDLLQAIDRIRQVVGEGGTLMDAVEMLEEDAEDSSEIDSLPLEPGRTDVVRLMNLHKAKGLEAPVVFLADPCGGFNSWPDVRIVRAGRRADGYLQVRVKFRNGGSRVLAHPAGWEQHAADEQRYLDAEAHRLLYVAATRARDLLVVGRWARTGGRGTRAWTGLDRGLTGAPELEVPSAVPDLAEMPVDLSDAALASFASARAEATAAALTPSWSIISVTAEARHISKVVRKAEGAADDPTRVVSTDTPSHRADAGAAWGSLIHGLLEHAMRHKKATGDDLRRLAMWLTVEEPELRAVIEEAVDTVQRVAAADFWREAKLAEECHVEVPFVYREETEGNRVVAGAVDLIYKQSSEWQLIDYKTDLDSSLESLSKRHRMQLEAYVAAWKAVVGEMPHAEIVMARWKRSRPVL